MNCSFMELIVLGGPVKLQLIVNLYIKVDIWWNWITELNPNFTHGLHNPLRIKLPRVFCLFVFVAVFVLFKNNGISNTA